MKPLAGYFLAALSGTLIFVAVDQLGRIILTHVKEQHGMKKKLEEALEVGLLLLAGLCAWLVVWEALAQMLNLY